MTKQQNRFRVELDPHWMARADRTGRGNPTRTWWVIDGKDGAIVRSMASRRAAREVADDLNGA